MLLTGMPWLSHAWARPRWILLVVVVIVAGITLGLVLARNESGDDGRGDEPRTEKQPALVTETPGAEPSSGPTKVPEPGSLDPVPVEEVETAPPVELEETGDFGTGVKLEIVEINAVEGKARGPGEISGPALQLVLEATNDSDKGVWLEGMVIALDHGPDHTPAIGLSEPGTDPFEGRLAAGGTARATYVFKVPVEERDQVRVVASYTGKAPTLVFRGDAR